MRLPIQYALTYPRREKCAAPPLDLTKLGALTFLEPDYDTFPCLALAIDAARYGDAVCAALCDADEEAVRLFLAGELSFTGIYEYVKNAVDAAKSALRGS
jgi:1-deoxy-D-xylulose-5-phosphate reductoisomerase